MPLNHRRGVGAGRRAPEDRVPTTAPRSMVESGSENPALLASADCAVVDTSP